MTQFKPMLAGKADVAKLTYPLLASPKLDGLRCVVLGGKPMTRNLKPIRNKVVREMLQGLPSLDGELIVGAPVGNDVFNRTQSAVMSEDGAPEFTFWVFDVILNKPLPFSERLELARTWARASGRWVQHVAHKAISTEAELAAYERAQLFAGYEGVMLRSVDGAYKYGRSTEREAHLLKLKRFEDSEAEITGFEELMHNGNVLTRDELGRAKRTTHKAGKRGSGTLGAIQVRDCVSGVAFDIGTGFDADTRSRIWENKEDYIGKIVSYTFQPTGVKDKPRFPVFKGFRDASDI